MQNVNRMTPEEKVKYMQTEPVQHLVCQMAVPTIMSMLITSFYNMADTFFVGRINTQATAAVGIVFSIMALIQAIGFFYGHGSGNYISRVLGKGEFDKASEMAATGFFLAFFTGIIAAIICIILIEPLAILLGSTETILPYTKAYLRIILVGAPILMSSLVLNNQLRFQGSASYGMIGIISGAVLNIILDPILIFVFDMGIAGAALATVIGQLVSLIILFIMTYKGSNIPIRFSNAKFNLKNFAEISRGGLPSLCRQGLGSIAQAALNNAAGIYGGEFGDAAIAGMSIVNRVVMFANSTLIGFGQGFQPVCGMNYGGKKYDRVKDAFMFCVKVALGFLLVVAVVGFVFSEDIVRFFRKEDADVIRVGALTLRLQMLSFPLSSVIVLCNMMLQSVGKAGRASLMASARQGLFLLPFVLILPRIWGLLGVQMSQMCADYCSFILAVPLAIGFLREMDQDMKAERSKND